MKAIEIVLKNKILTLYSMFKICVLAIMTNNIRKTLFLISLLLSKKLPLLVYRRHITFKIWRRIVCCVDFECRLSITNDEITAWAQHIKEERNGGQFVSSWNNKWLSLFHIRSRHSSPVLDVTFFLFRPLRLPTR